jgi:hypothetical protein
MAVKLTGLTHKIAIQLHLVVESCTVCSFRSRRPVRKLLDTHSYFVVPYNMNLGKCPQIFSGISLISFLPSNDAPPPPPFSQMRLLIPTNSGTTITCDVKDLPAPHSRSGDDSVTITCDMEVMPAPHCRSGDAIITIISDTKEVATPHSRKWSHAGNYVCSGESVTTRKSVSLVLH